MMPQNPALIRSISLSLACLTTLFFLQPLSLPAQELAGVYLVPHQIDTELKYRRAHEPDLACRIQLFVKGPAEFKGINSKSATQLLEQADISWHDLANAPPVPSGALSVWSLNGKSAAFAIGNTMSLELKDATPTSIALIPPRQWISAITFLRDSPKESNKPNKVMIYIENTTNIPTEVTEVRIWLPKSNSEYPILWPHTTIQINQTVPSQDKGLIQLNTDDLPLTYAAIEAITSQGTLWSHLRIKREQFDISGGWVFDSKRKWQQASQTDTATGMIFNSFLDLLSSMHINTAHYENADGYSDNPYLQQRNPLKRFAKLWPTERWEADAELSLVHAVEFLGEPQYGGGRPVPPQEVFDALLPYRTTTLPTTVTHSEERIWRHYAGLSDYPHFDAYRVVAPAADNWRLYDRWQGEHITWGAPLETIGNLCRSQRALNRPMPCAVWSQGPHDGWGGGFSITKRRARRSPNPDELRAQALHALASRITSLYWFNLSKSSLEKFPDTWEPMRRIGREIRVLEDFYLEGDAYRFQTNLKPNGTPDWELSSIVSPQGMLLFALDTDYYIDKDKQEFAFGAPRPAKFQFDLPQWLSTSLVVKRVDAEGLYDVEWKMLDRKIEITDHASKDRIYIVTNNTEVFSEIEARRRKAIEIEQTYSKTALAVE